MATLNEDQAKIAPPAPERKEPSSISLAGRLAMRKGAYLLAAVLFCATASLLTLALWPLIGWPCVVVAVIAGWLVADAVRIAYEWERVVVLRFGQFHRVVNPGPYLTIPVIEQVVLHVDQRICTPPFLNEHALTSDLAPVDVDAVVFWMVWDAKAAYTQVVNYPVAVSWAAQTALRDSIGRIGLTDLPMKRKQLDHEIQESLEQKVSDWGISVISVEIRDIRIPGDLQDAMSRAAQAERERDARIMLAEAEKEVSHMFVEAAETYQGNDTALLLRTANLLYEGVKDSGGMIVVPSSFTESVGEIERLAKRMAR